MNSADVTALISIMLVVQLQQASLNADVKKIFLNFC